MIYKNQNVMQVTKDRGQLRGSFENAA